MKNLRQFQRFDIEAFLSGKSLRVTALGPLTDFATGEHTGTKVEVVIIADDTEYKPGKDGTTSNNLYEKLVVKVKLPHTVDVAIGDDITLIGAVGTVYGDYGNKLSITAEAVKAINKAKG